MSPGANVWIVRMRWIIICTFLASHTIVFDFVLFSLIRPAHALKPGTPPVLGWPVPSLAAPVMVTMATHTARAKCSSLETDAIRAAAVKMEQSRAPRWPASRTKKPKLRVWALRLRPIPASSMASRLRLARPMWLPMDATPGEFATDIFPSALLFLQLLLIRFRPAFAHSFFCLHLFISLPVFCSTCSGGDAPDACTMMACAEPCSTCEDGSETYCAGVSYLSSDGCNTCTCTENGVSTCTMMACPPLEPDSTSDEPATCAIRGITYEEGETYVADDGCNTW